jgi:peroxiredoxin
MVRFAGAAVAALCLVASVEAARLKIGDPAPKFSGLECADGKSCSFDDMKSKDVVVVCITCNHCPYAMGVEDRLIAFNKKFCGKDAKVGLVAINVNNGEDDKLDRMKERAKAKSFNFPYAYDPTQKIAKDLGAAVTPEFFVFNKERRLVYTGAMDDGTMKGENVKTNYLEDAVTAALKGETPKTQETKAKGCGIQFDKTK